MSPSHLFFMGVGVSLLTMLLTTHAFGVRWQKPALAMALYSLATFMLAVIFCLWAGAVWGIISNPVYAAIPLRIEVMQGLLAVAALLTATGLGLLFEANRLRSNA